jgi:uncharacterized glyoxalase superfamily protein PhnB
MNIEITFNVITTHKLDESVDFYKKLFNFEIVADVGWYKQLKHSSGAEIGFMEPGHPTQPPLYQPGWDGKGLIISMQVKDVDVAYSEVRKHGIPIAFDLTEEEWGQKHFGIVDPNGIPIDVVKDLQ